MKILLENIQKDEDSSFKLLLTPGLNDVYYWHFHPEFELLYVEADRGPRQIGDHVTFYEESDLVLIGPHTPHLNFDYGVNTPIDQTIVQLNEDFLGSALTHSPEMKKIRLMMEKARGSLVFTGSIKAQVGPLLQALPQKNKFDQLLELLKILQLLACSTEYMELDAKPYSSEILQKHQRRMELLYRHVEAHYLEPIEVQAAADCWHLSVPAFCRTFKKLTGNTYTHFVLNYRINQAKKLLMQGSTVTEAAFDTGFESLSYFNRVFKKIEGVTPGNWGG
ncbi:MULTISPECIES: helix-turn-helix domain-containing protein [unclassified Paraflavitalea]|uniref:helix-turn-helix domain-containing protein n=1 Tax=unclassified Paraflavitalea TaxID=2798305 RepID=UPI003D34F67D